MAETLHFTAAMIGVVAVTNTAANMLVQRQFGLLADKWGDRTVSIVLAFLIPLVPLIWGLWVRVYWHAIAVEILSGLLWGGFNLVHFNSLLTQTPEDQRARFSAYYQIIVTLSMALGAALGRFDPRDRIRGRYPRINYWAPDCAVIFLVLVKETSTSNRPHPINTLPCQGWTGNIFKTGTRLVVHQKQESPTNASIIRGSSPPSREYVNLS